MTNGDRLRQSMTDMVIASENFCIFFDECEDCPLHPFGSDECTKISRRLEWLAQEVDENDTN